MLIHVAHHCSSITGTFVALFFLKYFKIKKPQNHSGNTTHNPII